MMPAGSYNESVENRWATSDSTVYLRKILLRNKHYSNYTANSHPKRNHTSTTSKVHVFLALGQTQISMTNTINSCHKMRRLIRGLLEKYPTFGREKETGLLGALDT
jgi:hypothetical protein